MAGRHLISQQFKMMSETFHKNFQNSTNFIDSTIAEIKKSTLGSIKKHVNEFYEFIMNLERDATNEIEQKLQQIEVLKAKAKQLDAWKVEFDEMNKKSNVLLKTTLMQKIENYLKGSSDFKMAETFISQTEKENATGSKLSPLAASNAEYE
jgi:hypothetical protein